MKNLLKQILPPFVIKALAPRSKYGWFGPYASWNDAKSRCTGYDAHEIMVKCRDALLEVKHGEAKYERDAVIFPDIQYSWPLLTGLMTCAAEHCGCLNVLDFGGSLGSSYFQNLQFIKTCREYTWSIIEQDHFVKCGKDCFEDEILKFYETAEKCLVERKPNLLLLSSVLQYLENPYEWAAKFAGMGIDYIVIDRTPFIYGKRDVILVQKVPPSIYNASYPCRAFEEAELLNCFKRKYHLLAEFDALDASNYSGMHFKGFILKKQVER